MNGQPSPHPRIRRTFCKDDRLCSGTLVEKVFRSGKGFSCPPFRIIFLKVPRQGHSPLQLMISIPKKRFRRAVLRNLIKRRIREAWRLNRNSLFNQLSPGPGSLFVALVYTGPEALPFAVLQEKIILILLRLSQYEKNIG